MTYLFPYVGAERKRERPKPKVVVKPKPKASIDPYLDLIKEICEANDVTLARVRSREFHPKLLLARRECVKRLRDEHGLSWRKIGTLMWRDRKACACLWDRATGEE